MPANNLGAFITKFTTRLDQVIMQETVTGDLNMNQDLLGEMSGNGTIKIAKMDMDGLATHVRGQGFTKGGISLEWEDYKLRYERDREFSIDVLDDEERAKLVSARAMGEFARTKVVPEVDALRFAELAKQAGNTVQADLAEADATAKAVLDAEQCMEDHGAKLSECLFYHSGNVKKLLRLSSAYRLSAGQAPNKMCIRDRWTCAARTARSYLRRRWTAACSAAWPARTSPRTSSTSTARTSASSRCAARSTWPWRSWASCAASASSTSRLTRAAA